MNCGRLLARNGARNGSGWRSTAKHAKLSGWRLGHEPKPRLANYGPRLRQFIANVQWVTLIFGTPMLRSCHPNDTMQLARKAGKPTISSGSTTPYANAVAASCAKRARSRKSWPTTSAPFGISFTTIMHSNARNAASLHVHDYPTPVVPSTAPDRETVHREYRMVFCACRRNRAQANCPRSCLVQS